MWATPTSRGATALKQKSGKAKTPKQLSSSGRKEEKKSAGTPGTNPDDEGWKVVSVCLFGLGRTIKHVKLVI